MVPSKGRSGPRRTARSAVNVLYNLMNPALRPVMLEKIRRRLTALANPGREGRPTFGDDDTFEEFCRTLDPALWAESREYADRQQEEAARTLASLPALGGGGASAVLYFCVRWLRPEFVLETGVAAGFSSHALLSAMERNGTGRLWSSDFPYFRLDSPERYVGILVPEHLRSRWTLSIEGDQVAVPRFLKEMPRVDLFHYDSDKSYEGRTETLSRVWPKLAPAAPVIVDDIHDNRQFLDFVSERALDHRTFRFRNKRVGLILPGASGERFRPTAASG